MKINMENRKTRRGLFYFIEKIFGLGNFFDNLPAKWIGISLLLFFLCLNYISLMHYYGRVFRKLHKVQQDFEDLRVTYSMLKAEYMQNSKRSELESRLESYGLIVSNHPPYVIDMSDKG